MKRKKSVLNQWWIYFTFLLSILYEKIRLQKAHEETIKLVNESLQNKPWVSSNLDFHTTSCTRSITLLH